MGLFSSKKTYVSSVAYNLAGDEEKRPNFLKTAITSHVLVGNRKYFSDTLQESYRYGPGLKLRSFYRWCEDNYSLIGMPSSNLASAPTMDTNVLADNITHTPIEVVNIIQAESGAADFSVWAEQYMFANHPELLDTDWDADYNETTNQIKITFEDTTTYSFTPSGFSKNDRYIYVVYNKSYSPSPDPYTEGDEVVLPTGSSFPSLSGWTTVSSETTPRTTMLHKLVTVTESFSDGRPDLVTATPSSITQSWSQFVGTYRRSIYEGNDGVVDGNAQREEMLLLNQYGTVEDVSNTTVDVIDIGGGVTKTVTTVIDDQVFTLTRKYRIDYRITYDKIWTPTAVYIYKIGSGKPALDAMVRNYSGGTGYFPFIPVRLDNKFLSPSYLPAAYNLADKAYKKAMGSKNSITEIIDQLASNENLSDIDYAYVMFGVSLNVKEQACRKYLYRFFDSIRTNGSVNRYGASNWGSKMSNYIEKTQQFVDWQLDQYDSGSAGYGTSAPSTAVYSTIPVSSINIKSSGSIPSNVDIRISWSEIKRVTGTGLAKPGAKKGEYWFGNYASNTYNTDIKNIVGKLVARVAQGSVCTLYHQIDENSWEALEIHDLVHKNYIYNGKYVETKAYDALNDADETGFIIPIHYPTFKAMSIVDSTQMSTACAFMVINTYLVKKTGFFGSFFFKILLVVAVIAITIFVPPAGAAVSGGVLGGSAAVGAALGFSGLAALIVGSIANALAAMIIMKAISVFSTAVFGEKFGQIVSMVLTVAAAAFTGNFSEGFKFNINNLGNISTLMQLTSSVGNVYAGIIASNVSNTVAKTQELLANYNDKSKEIDSLYEQNIGYSMGVFNPIGLTDTFNVYTEPPETFLARTLMTGSDLIEYQMSLITDFSDLSLNTRLPI